MSLRLFVDEDILARRLVHQLRSAGHDVVTVLDVGLVSVDDDRVLEYARRESRLVLTKNCKDFESLHKAGLLHAGIVALYEEYDRSKNMSETAILRALGNLEASGLELAGQFVPLNAWVY